MFEIRAVERPDRAAVEAARRLFLEYGEFLRERIACGDHWDMDRYRRETAGLPEEYTSRRGEVLLGYVDGEAAAMIVYRQGTHEDTESAEVKRLFVRPQFRGQGLARRMVEDVLQRIKTRGFLRAILDTNVEVMPAAFKLYSGLGFTEYAERVGHLAFLEKHL